MAELLHKDLTHQIISVYYTVYNKLSQTYPEFVYERAMQALLRRQGIPCKRQDEYEIRYKEKRVGLQRLDIFVAGEIVVELKVADRITALHLAQLLSYLKVVSKEVGLLFRFGGPAPEFARRVVTRHTWPDSPEPNLTSLTQREDWLHPELTYEIVGAAFEVFKILGPGFIHRIYANACYQELKLRGLEVMPRREFQVFMDDLDLGSIKLSHLQIDNRALLFPVALAHTENLKISNLQAWMRHLNIPLGVLINFKTTWLEPMILRL
jgi:GxxExxY protein